MEFLLYVYMTDNLKFGNDFSNFNPLEFLEMLVFFLHPSPSVVRQVQVS